MSKNPKKGRYQQISNLIGQSGIVSDIQPSHSQNLFGTMSDSSDQKVTNSFANQPYHFEPLMRITKLDSKQQKAMLQKKGSPFSSNLTDLYFPNNRPVSQKASVKDISSREELISFKQDQPVQKEFPVLPNFKEPNLITESNFEINRSDNDEEMELAMKLKPTHVCTMPTEQGISFDLVFTEAEAERKRQKSGKRAYLSTASTKYTRNSPKRSEEAEDDLEDLLTKRTFFIKKATDASAHLKSYAMTAALRISTAESEKFKSPNMKQIDLKINKMSKSVANFRQPSNKNLKSESSLPHTPAVARPFTAQDNAIAFKPKSSNNFKSKRSSVSSKSLKQQRSLSNLDELSKETSQKPTQNELPPEPIEDKPESRELTPEPQPVIQPMASASSPRSLFQTVLPPIVEEKDYGPLPLKDIKEDKIIQRAIVKGPPLSIFEAFPEETQEILNTINSVEEKLNTRNFGFHNLHLEREYNHLKSKKEKVLL